jgi:formamidopyrimidine-DNA glycosylase
VCEALHRARLSPLRRAGSIATPTGRPNERARRLVAAIKAVLEEAIAAGGSSLCDHRRTDGELGLFQHQFRVYDRAGEPCPTPGCTGTIRRIVQGGRSTFFCPACQK